MSVSDALVFRVRDRARAGVRVIVPTCVFTDVCAGRVMGLGENQQHQQPGGRPRSVRGRASSAEGGQGDVCEGQHGRRQEQLPGESSPSGRSASLHLFNHT